MALFYAGSVVVVIWLCTITFLIYKLRRHYNSLLVRTRQKSIDEILDTLLDHDDKFGKEIVEIKKTIHDTDAAIQNHYQKIGLVRFNPFERVGGDQSFVIALLNVKNSGIVLNFLYTREGIRVYAKPVTEGKSGQYELSTEEKEAMKKAH